MNPVSSGVQTTPRGNSAYTVSSPTALDRFFAFVHPSLKGARGVWKFPLFFLCYTLHTFACLAQKPVLSPHTRTVFPQPCLPSPEINEFLIREKPTGLPGRNGKTAETAPFGRARAMNSSSGGRVNTSGAHVERRYGEEKMRKKWGTREKKVSDRRYYRPKQIGDK